MEHSAQATTGRVRCLVYEGWKMSKKKPKLAIWTPTDLQRGFRIIQVPPKKKTKKGIVFHKSS
jgi:hypothetical protein